MAELGGVKIIVFESVILDMGGLFILIYILFALFLNAFSFLLMSFLISFSFFFFFFSSFFKLFTLAFNNKDSFHILFRQAWIDMGCRL